MGREGEKVGQMDERVVLDAAGLMDGLEERGKRVGLVDGRRVGAVEGDGEDGQEGTHDGGRVRRLVGQVVGVVDGLDVGTVEGCWVRVRDEGRLDGRSVEGDRVDGTVGKYVDDGIAVGIADGIAVGID